MNELRVKFHEFMNMADIHEIGMMIITGDVYPGSFFTLLVYMVKFSVVGLYMMNPTLWDEVHKVHTEGTNEWFGIYFKLMPDIKYLVDNF